MDEQETYIMGDQQAPSLSSSIEAITSSLPPETDHATYLTILESHLRPELLPALLEILQDHELTAHIGWDLVGLLMPFLPDSKACLVEVARWGNPREVMLKLLEALERVQRGSSSHGPSRSTSFEINTLLSLLCIVHPRIKTRYPSRFVSSTLQAVLSCFNEVTSSLPRAELDGVAQAVVELVKTLSHGRRPPLPPRQSTQNVVVESQSAPDPEAEADANTASSDERAIQTRLLQSFVTHVLEEYLSSSSSADDVPGLAWAARFQEKAHPEKAVPGKATFTQKFTEQPELKTREAIVSQLVAAAQNIDLDASELVKGVVMPAVDSPEKSPARGEHEYPTAAADIPLSPPGSLLLLAAVVASSVLSGEDVALPSFEIFPDHERVLHWFMRTDEAGGFGGIGQKSAALVDAVLALGLWAYDGGDLGGIGDIDYEAFHGYLQTLSVLSAHHPSPTIRYHAHLLCSSVLHDHPKDSQRLAFIRDTLEHCPFANLKASAVDWFKDEILQANRHQGDVQTSQSPPSSVFGSAETMASISPFLFPDLSDMFSAYDDDDEQDAASSSSSATKHWIATAAALLQTELPFYLASLNLYYLLLHAQDLQQPLDIPSSLRSEDHRGVAEGFVDPLRRAFRLLKDHMSRQTIPDHPSSSTGGGDGSDEGTGSKEEHGRGTAQEEEEQEQEQQRESSALSSLAQELSLPLFLLDAALARLDDDEEELLSTEKPR